MIFDKICNYLIFLILLEKQYMKSLLACNFNVTLLWTLPFIGLNIYPFLDRQAMFILSAFISTFDSLGYGSNLIILCTFGYLHR